MWGWGVFPDKVLEGHPIFAFCALAERSVVLWRRFEMTGTT